MDDGTDFITQSTCPPSKAVVVSAAPAKITCFTSILASRIIERNPKCASDPTMEKPPLSFPGLLRAYCTNSSMELKGDDLGTLITKETSPIYPRGRRTFCGS